MSATVIPRSVSTLTEQRVVLFPPVEDHKNDKQGRLGNF